MLDPAQLLTILEGNRRLTIRTLKAFTENDLFHYSAAPPMRPFGALIREILALEEAIMRAAATGEYRFELDRYRGATTARELLEACDSVREQTLAWWPGLTVEGLLTVEQDPWVPVPQSHLARIQFALENEIHHRGQGYVYLRTLGFEPPAFYER